jgi:hypothetical protein
MAQQHTTTNQSFIAQNQSWDVLRQLQGGEKLEVERKTGKKKVSGRFVSLYDSELIIARKGKVESFSRDEVKNIWRVAPPGRAKQVIGYICIGAGFYFGITAVGIGFQECAGSCVEEGFEMAAALIGIPIAGFLADRFLSKGKRKLIYSAP